jgi:CelD/BcsL family acetyltransferase involved in cellulose biosynthesis
MAAMKITTVAANELTPEHLHQWSELQRAVPTLESPYFRPEFTQAVAAVRPDVEVAILQEDGRTTGYFPFQRGRWGIGRPVGGRLSDFHGVVSRTGLTTDAAELIRGCRLRGWYFDHLLASQTAFERYHARLETALYVDLPQGFDFYYAQRCRAGSMLLRQALRKARKLEREVGPLRFVYDERAPEVFNRLIEWKRAQYQRTAAVDVLGFPWTRLLLERIRTATGEDFAGVMSALYTGDRLAAAHLGMRSRHVLHWWFPSYDVALGKYSPGLILLTEQLKAAAALGVRHIHLGKANAEYKSSFASAGVAVAEGNVAVHPGLRLLQRGWDGTRALGRTRLLAPPARLVGRLIRPLRGWLALR